MSAATVPALLALADGTIFRGRGIGAQSTSVGEVVFNTSMTGYQEILTDPSYAGQIVTLTYPHIGNTGVNDEDVESRKVYAAGLVIRDRRARRQRSSGPVHLRSRRRGHQHRYAQAHACAKGRAERMHRRRRDVGSADEAAACQGARRAFDGRARSRQGGELHRALRVVGRHVVARIGLRADGQRASTWSPGFGVKHNILRMLTRAAA